MVELKNITKTFENFDAVKDISFKINPGEIFGIVGPDGAGKSTLLRIIAGIIKCTKGSIFFNNKNYYDDIYYIKQHIGYMPQRFGLYEDLTVIENLIFFGKIYGLSYKQIKKNLPQIWNFSGLEPFQKRLAGKLSGGMKQKLGLACCIIHNPKLLILDEPTNGVDPVSRREFWKILYSLLKNDVAIIITTAYLDEAELSNRIALMYNGEFLKADYPDKIKNMIKKPLIEIITDQPVKLERFLKSSNKFQNIIRTGNSIKLFVEDKTNSKMNIKNLLVKNNLQFNDIKFSKPSLEDVFIESINEGQ